MKSPKKTDSTGRPMVKTELEAVYTLEVLCELVGVPSRTVLHYQEHGLISPAGAAGSSARRFDDEALRTLRRIEHLRARYEMNLRSLRFTLGLLDELERLRDDLRSRH
ncbi:MAG TPA: MerR family transcriptional regulator [Bryobacteraceae bacterium]|nr:MerR family transcriptional regulator [Bryobacteraceae bacterium]